MGTVAGRVTQNIGQKPAVAHLYELSCFKVSFSRCCRKGYKSYSGIDLDF